jgi:hypothetical protein
VHWDGKQVAALQDRNAGLVSIHRLARDAAPNVLHDADGRRSPASASSASRTSSSAPTATSPTEAAGPISMASSAISSGGSPALEPRRRPRAIQVPARR